MRKLTIEEARALWASRGHIFTDTEYRGYAVKHRGLCRDAGHEFWSRPNDIKTGYGCPICSGNRPLSLEEAQQRADEKGFELLDTQCDVYRSHKKYKIRCKKCNYVVVALLDKNGCRECKYASRRVYKTELERKLARYFRSRLGVAVRMQRTGRKPGIRGGSAVSDLGCTMSEFILYVEKLWEPGMNWDNYGEWHLDHIKPLASFDLTNHEDVALACHFTNMQPLWAFDNMSKNDRLDWKKVPTCTT